MPQSDRRHHRSLTEVPNESQPLPRFAARARSAVRCAALRSDLPKQFCNGRPCRGAVRGELVDPPISATRPSVCATSRSACHSSGYSSYVSGLVSKFRQPILDPSNVGVAASATALSVALSG